MSSDRDREVIVVDVSSPTQGHLIKRIKLDGNALGMTLDASQSRLYVAQDNADQVAVIDTGANRVVAKIDARGPAGSSRQEYTGAGTSAVTLSPDGSTFMPSIAERTRLRSSRCRGEEGESRQRTYPHRLRAARHHLQPRTAAWMYIVSGKSVTGPNPDHLAGATASITSIMYPGGNAAAAAAARASNQYQFQLERASLVSAPVPNTGQLQQLTKRVAEKNFYAGRGSTTEMTSR